MKRMILAATLTVALGAASPLAAAAPTAYPTHPQEPISTIGGRDYQGGEDVAPARGRAAHAARMRSRIQEVLEISDEQADRLEGIVRASMEAKRDANRALAETHRDLTALVERDAPAAELRPALDRLVAAKRAAASAGESYEQILALLGPEKTARFALMSAQFVVQRRTARPGWRGSDDDRWGGDRRRGPTW